MVESWKRRLSTIAGGPVGDPHIHLAGRDAVALLGIDLDEQRSSPSPRFEVAIYTQRLNILTATFASLRSPDTLSRTKGGGRQTTDDLVVATLIEHGNIRLEESGRSVRYRPGELIIAGNTDKYIKLADSPVAAVGVMIPRSLLGKRRRVLKRAAQPYISSSLLARSTAAFLTGFAVPLATGVIAEPSAETEQAVLDLVISVLCETPGRGVKLTDNPVFVREAVADLIERYYAEPDFGIEVIADALHLSRRQVYRYFEDTGQSLAARIAERRLQAAVDLLETQPRMSVSTLARQSGFASEATFRSRFRAGLGYGPTEARARVLNGESLPTIGPAD
ncbi:helix-turn-helix transcriptional regulator [Gordonia sp. (in: high G+C Gram-positive bacteria)]|uniref:helix-turn-helix transcriptional regulator n=1 Tax=Gordonia sp. (in: high G+C Gram-positive bacteria) TaxID=84139 RepID=UPI00262BB3C8|nr:helix-turn-helix transcriptional regulator [Gordonia sp. (in: high G+C Gram-positive bacteria)]